MLKVFEDLMIPYRMLMIKLLEDLQDMITIHRQNPTPAILNTANISDVKMPRLTSAVAVVVDTTAVGRRWRWRGSLMLTLLTHPMRRMKRE